MPANYIENEFFKEKKLRCQETGEYGMQDWFLRDLIALRSDFGKPMVVSSGYRSPRHSIEAKKPKPGTHAKGVAVDIKIRGANARELVGLAISHGFRIGVSQRGTGRFIHLDKGHEINQRWPVSIWSY